MGKPVLICAVCQRPVERWVAIDSPSQTARTFEAHCHGAIDICTLSLRAMNTLSQALSSGERVEAVAFAGHAIAGRHALAAQHGASPDAP